MYTFRLDPVLRKEQYIEEQLQKDLATTAKKVEEEQHLLEVIGEEKESYSLELERKKSKKMRVGEMELFDCFFNALSVEEGLQNGKVQDARERFEGTRNRLVKVMQKRKSLESLKEKGVRNYRTGLRKKQEAFLDEIALRGFVAKRSS